MNDEIARRLAELRRSHGYSQEGLAAELDLSRQAVSKWERGESAPDMGNLIALAKLYGVSIDELLCVEGAAEAPGSEESASEEGSPASTASEAAASETAAPTEAAPLASETAAPTEAAPSAFEAAAPTVAAPLASETAAPTEAAPFASETAATASDSSSDRATAHAFAPSAAPDPSACVGHIYPLADDRGRKREKGPWEKFPYWAIALALFFAIGFLGYGGWTYSWLAFVALPICYWFGRVMDGFYRIPSDSADSFAPERKSAAAAFPYPVLCVIMFCLSGFFIYKGWLFSWMVFLSIPFYYWIVRTVETDPLYLARRDRRIGVEPLSGAGASDSEGGRHA